MKDAGVNPGSELKVGSMSQTMKKVLTDTVAQQVHGSGTLADAEQVSIRLFPTSSIHLEANGKTVLAMVDDKGKGSGIPDAGRKLQTLEPYVGAVPKAPKPSKVVTSGDLCFSSGFRTNDKTRRELIDAYMKGRALEKENLVLQLRSSLHSWSQGAKDISGLVGTSFNDLPEHLKKEIYQSAKAFGEFSSKDDLDKFLAGAKISRTRSYLAGRFSYRKKDGTPSGFEFPITPPQ